MSLCIRFLTSLFVCLPHSGLHSHYCFLHPTKFKHDPPSVTQWRRKACEIDSHMHSFNQCFYWCLKQPSAQTESRPKVKRGIPLDSVHLHIRSHSHTHVHTQTPIDLTGLAGESTSSLVTLEKTGQPGLRGWRCEEREMVGECVAPKLKVRSITSNIQDKLSPSPFHLQPWTAEQSL